MKPTILKAWALYRYVLSFQLKNWFVFFLIFLALVTIVGVSWDTDYQKVYFLGLGVGRIGELREYALQDAFVDFHKLIWLLALFAFIPSQILFRLSNSYTVSNTLWLRLSPMDYHSITLYRCLIVVGITSFLMLISFIWAYLFGVVHDVSFRLLIQPILCLGAFMLLTGGLMIWLSPGATASAEFRYGLVVAISAIPFILHMFRRSLANYLGDFVPYVYTYSATSLSSTTLRATLTAGLLGVLLLLARFIFSYRQNQSSIIKNENR